MNKKTGKKRGRPAKELVAPLVKPRLVRKMRNSAINSIETVEFKRRRGGEVEAGLLLNEGDLLIIDRFGKAVPQVWNFQKIPGLSIHGLNIGKVENNRMI
jgi:hypothetical protein